MTTATPRRDSIKHVFLWPAFLVVLVVSLFPLIYALSVSFQTMRLVPPSPPRFVGLDNYAAVLASGRFWGSIWTTAVIVFVSVALQYVIGLVLALALHHSLPARWPIARRGGVHPAPRPADRGPGGECRPDKAARRWPACAGKLAKNRPAQHRRHPGWSRTSAR